MKKLCSFLLLALIFPMVGCRGGAEDAGQSAEGPESAALETATATEDSPEPIDLVHSSLRAVATAQETHWQEHQAYTTDLDVLKQIPGCEIQENVVVTIVEVSENGWAMEATHPEFAERSCVQWYGRPGAVGPIATAREGKRGDESPGRVVCDTP
jgi:hypothetical protein